MARRDILIEAGGDLKGVKDVEQRINSLNPPVVPVTDPVLDQWNTNNPWINEESPKASYARDIFQREAAIQGNTMSNALTKVNAAVARHYPDKQSDDPLSETGSMPRGNKPISKTLTMNEVTPEELRLRVFFPHFKDDKVFLQAVKDSRKRA